MSEFKRVNDARLHFTCPHCSGSIIHTASAMMCEGCSRRFPIVRDIPRFVHVKNYASSFGLQWHRHADAQCDSHTGLTISRDRLFSVSHWPTRMAGETILEAGSGAGRFTEILLSTGAEVYSFDMSSAVEVNARRHEGNPHGHFFQASIFDIPFAKKTFDRVICLGVLQHTPNPEAAFHELVSYVKPGGNIVIDVYKKTFFSLMQWKYLLRPLTKRIPSTVLYDTITQAVPRFFPYGIKAYRFLGRFGARAFPIALYPDLGLSDALHKEWSVLDTFDMYSPAHDHPQTLTTIRRWFHDADLRDVTVAYGPNGIIGRGRKDL
jgi:2-polyprenyl-3-methyl-5-hydroxy-6-metoxy-1,4-benzoquinol methylase